MRVVTGWPGFSIGNILLLSGPAKVRMRKGPSVYYAISFGDLRTLVFGLDQAYSCTPYLFETISEPSSFVP